MSIIDVEALLVPLSDDAPCGENLEYDATFIEMESLARGKAEQQFGDAKFEAEEPEWPDVERLALDLARRTRDLRVGIYLVRTQTALEGFGGLAAALTLVREYLLRFWPGLHPELDPDDDNDPTIRLNTLSTLCDAETVLRLIRATPLTQSRQFGKLGYRHYAIAAGLAPPPGAGAGADGLPDASTVDLAFTDTALEPLQQVAADIAAALDALQGIDRALSDQIGSAFGLDLTPVRKLLREIRFLVDQKIAARTGDAPAAEDAAAAGPEGELRPAAPSGAAGGVPGSIRNSADVAMLLDRICRYYAESEPSSPVPILLERAKRLIAKDFMQILRDLAPEGMRQFSVIAGTEDHS